MAASFNHCMVAAVLLLVVSLSNAFLAPPLLPFSRLSSSGRLSVPGVVRRGRTSSGVRSATSVDAQPRQAAYGPQGVGGDDSLGGAWDPKSGGRSKKWFEETEKQRQGKVVSVRVSHILVSTSEMASTLMTQLREGADFAGLASAISMCEGTREKGGEVGWVSLNDEFLDETLPIEARETALLRKPGDMVSIGTELGVHIIKVDDVMENLVYTSNPAARLKGEGVVSHPLRELLDKDPDTKLSYAMETMGCQMNTADTERMAGQLEAMGLISTDKIEEANVVVFNTCSIRDKAEHKLYSALGPSARRKRKGENVAVVVAGCVAQQEGEELVKKHPEVDLVMGPQYANRIGDLLEEVINGNQVVATEANRITEDVSKPRRGSTTCAWVNIIYGCNERCTYCVVPTTRGVEQSRSKESIVAEMRMLAAQGYKEVTLLGQNIDAWGRDMEPKGKFSDLLRHVSEAVPEILRIRFVTAHPRYMSLAVVDAVHASPSCVESFHVPFQSGDDAILQAMGRGHTVEQYMKIIDRIREVMPDAGITADCIVGFPGETEEQFQHSLDLMERVKFDMLNTASYSPRPNTPAALWENQVPEEVKKERLQRMNDLGKKHALERSERYLGRVVEVLVEERNAKRPSQVKGRIRQGRSVFFDADIDQTRGKLVKVLVDKVQPFYLIGKMVEGPTDDGEGEGGQGTRKNWLEA